MKTIHITTGDLEGIGLEVSLKALSQIGPLKNTQFVLWRDIKTPPGIFRAVDKKFKRVTKLNPKPPLFQEKKGLKNNILWDIAGPPTPTKWVEQAGKLCLKFKKTHALVTGPLSKTQMKKEKFKERGHTELLKKLSKKNSVFMAFLGEYFNVVLLTGHIPLKKVKWKDNDLHKCISFCLKFKKNILAFPSFTSSSKKNSKLSILGLNPHAGEAGLLGREELLLKPLLKKWKDKVKGPLVPDVAFCKENWRKYFMYLCLYHDQGLIPFKMIHGLKGFQISLGLPFVRASVSHGTAQDIFGKNLAKADSMKKALLWAIWSLNNPL